MKKFLLLVSTLMLMTLSGCMYIDSEDVFDNFKSIKNDDDVLDQVVETSEIARESNIYIQTTLTYKDFWGIVERKSGGVGSGFVYKEDDTYYYALTNFHVIDPKDSFSVEYMVRFDSGQEVTGTVIAKGNDTLDLAVIRFPKSGEDLPLTTIDPEHPIRTNDFVLVVGNPSGLQNVVTPTKISGHGVYLKDIDYKVIVFSYSMDAHGNSGGAVVDLYGDLVGILTWQGLENEDQKFAIPVNQIYDFIEENELLP